MRKKGVAIAIALVLIGVLALLVVGFGKSEAQETRMVRIHDYAAPGREMALEPDTIWIAKGTVVIWTNFARGQVRVVFEEGKKCEDVTSSPSGFKLDSASCFVTTYMNLGATSSLKFDQEGTFNYVVEAQGKEKKVMGKIIVQ